MTREEWQEIQDAVFDGGADPRWAGNHAAQTLLGRDLTDEEFARMLSGLPRPEDSREHLDAQESY